MPLLLVPLPAARAWLRAAAMTVGGWKAPGETAGLVLRVEIGYVVPVMRQPASKQKKLDYPEATNGTRWAAEARRLASKLTPEQEAEHFRRAMAKVYGGKHKEVAGA
jgi:hypothetical protein